MTTTQCPRSSLTTGLTLFGAITLTACGGSSDSDNNLETAPSFPEGAIMLDASDLTRSAKEAMIQAESGAVIVFPEGRFKLSDTLTFDADSDGDGNAVSNITILGYGKDKTILDFSESGGGDGIFIQNGVNVTIKDLAVYEAANNGIKFKDTNGIHIQSVATVWEGALDENNGAYGLYPVESENILIEDSYVRGSADAGIYVGQSRNIVVRRNVAEENVAGIEIENSEQADVYDNIARGNTGGVLIFDLPIGNGLYGSNVRIFDNEITGNNTENFANASSNPAGVHIVPPGTGVIVLSTRDVEIYNNRIDDHNSMSVAISSYYLADENFGTANPQYTDIIDDGFEAVPRNIHIHDNLITNSSDAPEGELISALIAGYQAFHNDFPAVLYDGLGELLANAGVDPTATGPQFTDADRVCASNNGDVSFGQVFGTDPTDPANVNGSMEPVERLFFEATQTSLLACATTPARLSAATATINGVEYGCGSAETGDASAASCAL